MPDGSYPDNCVRCNAPAELVSGTSPTIYACGRVGDDFNEDGYNACEYAESLRKQILTGTPDPMPGVDRATPEGRIAMLVHATQRKINNAGMEVRREFERSLATGDPDQVASSVAVYSALVASALAGAQLLPITEELGAWRERLAEKRDA